MNEKEIAKNILLGKNCEICYRMRIGTPDICEGCDKQTCDRWASLEDVSIEVGFSINSAIVSEMESMKMLGVSIKDIKI